MTRSAIAGTAVCRYSPIFLCYVPWVLRPRRVEEGVVVAFVGKIGRREGTDRDEPSRGRRRLVPRKGRGMKMGAVIEAGSVLVILVLVVGLDRTLRPVPVVLWSIRGHGIHRGSRVGRCMIVSAFVHIFMIFMAVPDDGTDPLLTVHHRKRLALVMHLAVASQAKAYLDVGGHHDHDHDERCEATDHPCLGIGIRLLEPATSASSSFFTLWHSLPAVAERFH